MDTVSPACVLSNIQKEFTSDSRSVIVEDKSQDAFNDSGVDWDEFWNGSILHVYRSDLSTLSLGSTFMTALYRWAISVSATQRI